VSRKLNCWQFKNCGREKGGLMSKTLGVCPVALAMRCDGQNHGIAGGRVCWTLRNSGNRLTRSGICAAPSCHTCEFYRRVLYEEAELAQFRFSCDRLPLVRQPEDQPIEDPTPVQTDVSNNELIPLAKTAILYKK